MNDKYFWYTFFMLLDMANGNYPDKMEDGCLFHFVPSLKDVLPKDEDEIQRERIDRLCQLLS